MLYNSAPGLLSLHIFGEKDENRPIGLPLNSWVTIQIAFSQKKGFQMFLLDPDGQPLVK